MNTPVKMIFKYIFACFLLLIISGCVDHFRHIKFSDEHIRNYNCVFKQSPPKSVTILRSRVSKVLTIYSFGPPPEPSLEEWDKVRPSTWAFEVKAPKQYVEKLKSSFKLKLASNRADFFKNPQYIEEQWYPKNANEYVIYSYGNFYLSTTPYWEMLIVPETENKELVHFYIKYF